MTKATLIYTRRLLILTICLLFITFFSMEVYNIKLDLSPNVIKFFAIILCFIISIVSNPLNNQSKNTFLLQLGLIFTIMADYIFLIRNNNYTLAVGLFSIVQIIYSLRYREGNEEKRIMSFIVLYIIIVMIYKVLNRNLIVIDFLIAIAVFYGICLISSVKGAWLLYKNDTKQNANKMILIGMILFLLCDLNLGLNYILNEATFMANSLKLLKTISSISIWAYYLPSQLLLALSGTEL